MEFSYGSFFHHASSLRRLKRTFLFCLVSFHLPAFLVSWFRIGWVNETRKIDVLCLYSEEVRERWGNLTSVQMESRIKTYFVEANEGNSNSLIPLTYNVFVRPVSFELLYRTPKHTQRAWRRCVRTTHEL